MTITITAPSTSDVLKDMLTENTGRHMLDSGGAYGRNWERNQNRDFDAEPKASMSFGPTLSLYHFLNDRLEYAPIMDRLFNIVSADSDEPWLVDMQDFAERVGGEAYTYNSYNTENMLSQDIQWTQFTYGWQTYILLQIHGGCDIRGGYTKPRAFIVEPDWAYGMNDAEIYCTSCDFGFSIMGSEYIDKDGSFTDISIDLWDSDTVCPECGSPLGVDATYYS
jgi:hypothetical protein